MEPDIVWVLPVGMDVTDPASSSYWFICYPKRDRGKLHVAELCDSTSYEERGYDIASRKRFRDEQMAWEYCRELARRFHLEVEDDRGIALLD